MINLTEMIMDILETVMMLTAIVVAYTGLLLVIGIVGEKYIRLESVYYTYKVLMWLFLTMVFLIPVVSILHDFIMKY